MKILDLKKTAVILVTMLLFLSMQISAFASDNCTVVKIPVRQIFDSEVEGIADEFSLYYDNRIKATHQCQPEAAICSIPGQWKRMQQQRLY